MAITLDAVRGCLEGVIPAVIATCAPDGMPNLAYLSQVHYVDSGHVALSFQFFSKTRENILANPLAVVQVVDPDSAVHYRLTLHYLRTETAGPLFEHMKAKLAGIASHTGMSKVFRLLGADVYGVESIEAVGGGQPPCAQPVRSRLPSLRNCSRALAACADLDGLLETLLAALEREFDIRHAMVLMAEPARDRLYTVASRGYPTSGVGSELPFGAGNHRRSPKSIAPLPRGSPRRFRTSRTITCVRRSAGWVRRSREIELFEWLGRRACHCHNCPVQLANRLKLTGA